MNWDEWIGTLDGRPTLYQHFDICLSKRMLAVKAGAVSVTQRELERKLMERREARA